MWEAFSELTPIETVAGAEFLLLVVALLFALLQAASPAVAPQAHRTAPNLRILIFMFSPPLSLRFSRLRAWFSTTPCCDEF
jgi:hypothetical protein